VVHAQLHQKIVERFVENPEFPVEEFFEFVVEEYKLIDVEISESAALHKFLEDHKAAAGFHHVESDGCAEEVHALHVPDLGVVDCVELKGGAQAVQKVELVR
jgi:hypothetical protein